MKELEDKGWEQMQLMLDQHLPQKRKKKLLLWWFFGVLSFLMLGGYMIRQHIFAERQSVHSAENIEQLTNASSAVSTVTEKNQSTENQLTESFASNPIDAHSSSSSSSSEVNVPTHDDAIMVSNELKNEGQDSNQKTVPSSKVTNQYASRPQSPITIDHQTTAFNKKNSLPGATISNQSNSNLSAAKSSSLSENSKEADVPTVYSSLQPDNDSHAYVRQANKTSNGSAINLVDDNGISPLPTKHAYLEVGAFDGPENMDVQSLMVAKDAKQKTKLLSIAIETGLFANASLKYGGVYIQPELGFGLTNKLNFSVGLQLRGRINDIHYLSKDYEYIRFVNSNQDPAPASTGYWPENKTTSNMDFSMVSGLTYRMSTRWLLGVDYTFGNMQVTRYDFYHILLPNNELIEKYAIKDVERLRTHRAGLHTRFDISGKSFFTACINYNMVRYNGLNLNPVEGRIGYGIKLY